MASSAGENGVSQNASAEAGNLNITVDFGGGMEVLFSYKRSHEISLPRSLASLNNSNGKATIGDLIGWLLENLLSDKTRPELFASALPSSSSGDGNGGRKSVDGIMKEGVMEKDGKDKVEYTVRPGILVLVNDTDWELEGEREYELQEGDNIMFISTLHGG